MQLVGSPLQSPLRADEQQFALAEGSVQLLGAPQQPLAFSSARQRTQAATETRTHIVELSNGSPLPQLSTSACRPAPRSNGIRKGGQSELAGLESCLHLFGMMAAQPPLPAPGLQPARVAPECASQHLSRRARVL